MDFLMKKYIVLVVFVITLVGCHSETFEDSSKQSDGFLPDLSSKAAFFSYNLENRQTHHRGVMVSNRITVKDLSYLVNEWHVNIIRFPIGTKAGVDINSKNFDDILEQDIQHLDSLLPFCQEYGIYVVLDLHNLSKGIFESSKAAKKLVSTWEMLAEKYWSSAMVIGYDIANEPYLPDIESDKWQTIAEETAKAIRNIDPYTAIIIQPHNSADDPEGLKYFEPIEVANVVYSIHVYVPYEFTHQFVSPETNTAYEYPGECAGYYWDKDLLRKALAPAYDFQEKYKVPIYVGEFSAVRFAPKGSAYRYLADSIEIFEEFGWDWTYHAFREASCWSVEHNEALEYQEDTEFVDYETDREALLKSWFIKNKTSNSGSQTEFYSGNHCLLPNTHMSIGKTLRLTQAVRVKINPKHREGGETPEIWDGSFACEIPGYICGLLTCEILT